MFEHFNQGAITVIQKAQTEASRLDLNEYKVKNIVTACPHCFHTLKNEFPDFGGHYEVKHHSQFINELVTSGQLKINQETGSLLTTFHDPCYLGCNNGIYEEPRDVIKSLGYDTQEMEKSRDKSFCCGAGGGQMWREEKIGVRVNMERTRQILETEAQMVGVACPFCMTMIDDGLKANNKADSVKVKELAERVIENIEAVVPKH